MTKPPPVRPESGPQDEADLSIDHPSTVRILTKFIAGEVRRSGHEKVVLGLSGGIDSAVAACLASRALGPRAVICLRMPFESSSPDSLTDAQKVVADLGVACETVDVTPIVRGFSAVSGDVGRLRLGNVMARARMMLLFDRSAEHEALVLGSSNKTELLLGYGTLHGDLAHALNPLGDLYKTQVRALAKYLDVPQSIRRKPPSADLWPDQSDEGELGFSYESVDRLLSLIVDARVSRQTAIEDGFSPEMVDAVMRRIVRNQFKRRPPLIAKISTRSIGWDFRYPRDWLS